MYNARSPPHQHGGGEEDATKRKGRKKKPGGGEGVQGVGADCGQMGSRVCKHTPGMGVADHEKKENNRRGPNADKKECERYLERSLALEQNTTHQIGRNGTENACKRRQAGNIEILLGLS